MNKTKIEWADYTWNPITGCQNNCSYCYARKIATRFKGTKAFPNGFNPTFHLERLNEPTRLKKSSKIFVCSMGELFAPWVEKDWVEQIFSVIHNCPQHIFQILTKFPQCIPQFRTSIWDRYNSYTSINYPSMPDNVWLGVTITGKESKSHQWNLLKSLAEINVDIRFFSFEPLLAEPMDYRWEEVVEWIIIGAQTNPYIPPKKEWVARIVNQADSLGVPVFLKNNLKPVMGENLIKEWQEFPSMDLTKLINSEAKI